MRLFLILFFITPLFLFGQDGFKLNSKKKKLKIPFQLINNLIFIPINVNGVDLNFLLDTGVEETILFSLDDKEEIQFFNVETIKLRGLGSSEYIEGLKSDKNKLHISNDFWDDNHQLFIILDQTFNISSSVGIPVNGIIGSKVFKNYKIEINYITKKLIVHQNSNRLDRKLNKKFKEFDIALEKNKPYIVANLTFESKNLNARLLLDIGNTDALWLFPSRVKDLEIPKKNFDDYLGKGFSGEIYGKRAKVDKLLFDTFQFKEPYVSFPDSISIQHVTLAKDRIGSVGAEILRRFRLVFDYQNNKLYLKKNSHFSHPFNFNMSGVEFVHEGLQWVQETVMLSTTNQNTNNGGTLINLDPYKYKFELKPVFSIGNVRKNSPAFEVGLKKGDVVISINGKKTYNMSLQELNNLMKSEEGKKIIIEVERKNLLYKYTFYLKSIL